MLFCFETRLFSIINTVIISIVLMIAEYGEFNSFRFTIIILIVYVFQQVEVLIVVRTVTICVATVLNWMRCGLGSLRNL